MKTPSLRMLDPKTRRIGLGSLAIAMLLAGAVLGYGGWQQHEAQSTQQEVSNAKDALLKSTQQEIATAIAAMEQHASTDAVRSAAANGDLGAASTALAQGWKDATNAQVYPSDLDTAYLGKPIYARLSLMEASLRDGKGRAGAVKEKDNSQMAVATPIVSDGHVVGVAFAELPIKSLLDATSKARIEGPGYLALRQGAYSIAEQGDKQLARSVEAEEKDLKQSAFSVVSVGPVVVPGPLGLGWMASLGAAVVLLVGGILAALAAKRMQAVRAPVIEDWGPTVAERQAAEQAEAPKPARVAVRTPAAKLPMGDAPVLFVDGLGAGRIQAGFERSKAVQLGQQMGAALRARGVFEVATGRDARDSSTALLEGLIEGFVASGLRVHDLGSTPTALVAFAVSHLGTGAGVSAIGTMIHPDHTGLQVVMGGKILGEDTLAELARGAGETSTVEAGSRGQVNVDDVYLEHASEEMDLPRKLVVEVVGEHRALLVRALAKHGVSISEEPGAELCLTLSDNGTALSLSDARGTSIAPSGVLSILAEDLLERAPGSVVVADAATAEAIASKVLSRGGIVQEAGPDIGVIQASMVEGEAALGGDEAGHVILVERGFNMPDGVLAAVRLMDILAEAHHSDEIFIAHS